MPKTKKFSFSKKLSAHTVTDVEPLALVDEPLIQNEFPKGAYVLSKVTMQDFSPKELEEKDVYLYDLENCKIDLRGIKVSAIHTRNISKCFIISNPIQGSFLGHSCLDSTLVIGCKQVL